MQREAAAQFLTLHINTMHVLAFTSWESLLDKLNPRALQAEDVCASSDIWQLQSLCARIDAEAFQPLSEDEIISPTQMRINQFRDLINELTTRLVDSGIASLEGYRATPGPDSYKRYMSIHGLPNSDWCVEFNNAHKKQLPQIKLWLSVTNTPQLSGLLTILTQVSYRQGNQFNIPLEIPVGVEREIVLTNLFSQVVGIVKQLSNG